MVKAFVIGKVGSKNVKIFIKDLKKLAMCTKRQVPNIPNFWKISTDNNNTETELSKSHSFGWKN